MSAPPEAAYVAFEGDRCIASGDLREVARSAKAALGRHPHASILIFNAHTSALVDVDFRGSLDDVLARIPAALRGGDPRAVRRRRAPFRKVDRRMARRCARSCGQARRIRISAEKLSRDPVDPACLTR
jgi:hypothetical protein